MSAARPAGVRRTAARLLDRALASRRPLDAALDEAAAGVDARDAALLRHLLLGGVRWMARLDRTIEDASGVPMARIDRRLHAPLRLGAYQLLFLDRVPAYAAVDESVTEARRRAGARAAGFANRILRRLAERPDPAAWPVDEPDPIRRLAIETSYPEALVRRWLERFGEARARALLDAGNRPAGPGLLAFRDRGGRGELVRALAADGVATEPSTVAPEGLLVVDGDPLASGAFARGELYVQDPASQAAALVPAPRPGETILDLAAAPGGKSFTLLSYEPAVRVVAGDRSPRRIGLLRANLARLRRRLPLVAADAARPPFAAGFDRVVCDLPCSGTGTFRRHPELKWRFSEAELSRLARLQRRLLDGAAGAVRRGGLLAAVTCSLEPEENEERVAELLAARPDFEPLDLEGRVPEPCAPAITGPGRWQLPAGPQHDGFTVHVLRRHLAGRHR